MKKWIIDIDGVLADFNSAFKKELGLEKDIIFDSWDWPRKYCSDELVNKTWEEVQKDEWFWRELLPFPTVESALAILQYGENNGDEIYFVTSRQGFRVKCQTEGWLEHYGCWKPTVITVRHSAKWGIVNNTEADVMIDDRPKVLLEARTWGKRKLRLYMPVWPYNEDALKNVEQHGIIPVRDILEALEIEDNA